MICANAAELLQQHEALDLTDEVVLAAVERGVHERTRRHASMDPASGDGSRDELSSASRTLTSAAREARVALLAGGRVGRDILQMPAYRIPPLTGGGEGGDEGGGDEGSGDEGGGDAEGGGDYPDGE